jgi:hypothetical protein
MTTPRRVDPPRCGCNDCVTGGTVPLDQADWQTVKAMLAGEIQDATGTELHAHVVVTLLAERDWNDGQRWKWEYDRRAPAALAELRELGAWLAASAYDSCNPGQCACGGGMPIAPHLGGCDGRTRAQKLARIAELIAGLTPMEERDDPDPIR